MTTPRDLLLDNDGDLALVDGDLQLVSGVEAIRQDAQLRLRFIRGEWFLDPTVGVPYFQDVFVKNPDLARIRAVLIDELRRTPGIVEVPELTVTLDSATRRLTGTFRAVTSAGDVTGQIGATP